MYKDTESSPILNLEKEKTYFEQQLKKTLQILVNSIKH